MLADAICIALSSRFLPIQHHGHMVSETMSMVTRRRAIAASVFPVVPSLFSARVVRVSPLGVSERVGAVFLRACCA